VIEIDGQRLEFEDPGNFPDLLLAHFFNRHGVVSEELSIGRSQRFLRTETMGKIVGSALDRLIDDEASEDLLLRVYDDEAELPKNENDYWHAQIIERAEQHLPQGLDMQVLRDAWRFEVAA
jgi:hypothetical protein